MYYENIESVPITQSISLLTAKNIMLKSNDPFDISFLIRLAREEPRLYAKLVAKDDELHDSEKTMKFNWLLCP